MKFVSFGKVEEFLDPKDPIGKKVEGQDIVVFKKDGKFCALSNICSHAGGRLSDGEYDGKAIQCPLHATRFDVESGAVLSPPATRPQPVVPVRVSGDTIEVDISTVPQIAPKPTSTSLLRPTYWRLLLRFLPIPILFWIAQFLLQYYWLNPGEVGLSLVYSFAFAGATLVGTALFSSAIFKWRPLLARHWRIRRYLGVSGWLLIALHALSAWYFFFGMNYYALYFSYNPTKNPVVFGSIALAILTVMAATSTDWAVDKLTPRVWKFIHRFVYVAYISAIFHFSLMNPAALNTPPGYLLVVVTALTLFGQLYWFFKIVSRRRFRTLGTVVGFSLILGTLILIYLVING